MRRHRRLSGGLPVLPAGRLCGAGATHALHARRGRRRPPLGARDGRVAGAALALLLVLLLDPWAVLAAGFWLSFGAVALLFHIGSGRLGPVHWLVEWGARNGP
jgi:hypothetical protein